MRKNRRHCRLGQIHGNKVCALPFLQRTDQVVHTDGLGAINRSHTQRFPRGHNFRILIFDLIKQCGKLHLVDDIVAVISGGLIGTKAHHAAGILECLCRRNNTVNDTDRARAQQHRCAAASHLLRLIVAGIRQMNRNQRIIQKSQLVQECNGALSVTLYDLIGFTVTLLHVHMDLGVSLLRQRIHTLEQLRTEKIDSLRAKQNPDATIGLVMPFVIQFQILLQRLFTQRCFKFIKLPGCVCSVRRFSDRRGDIPARTNFLNKLADRIHICFVIAQSRSSGFQGFDDRQTASGLSLRAVAPVHERLQAIHHPISCILSQSSENAVAGMHVAVDEAGKHRMMLQIQDFLTFVLTLDLFCRTNCQNFALVYGHDTIF